MTYLNQNKNRRTDIGSSLNEIGNTFSQIRSNMPRIIIGNQGISTNTQKVQNNQPISPRIAPLNDKKTGFDPSKIFNYAFWVMIGLVFGYAAYRLIMMFIGK